MRAKWNFVAVQLTLLLNSYLVTGVDDGFENDLLAVESRSPYVVYPQREYVVEPSYSTTTSSSVPTTPRGNATRGSLKAYTEELKRIQNEATSSEEQEYAQTDPDQDEAGSVASHRFENAYTKFNNYRNDEAAGQESSRQDSIQDVLDNKQQVNWQSQNQNQNQGGNSNAGVQGQAQTYDTYSHYPSAGGYQQSPVISYEVPTNFFPDDWTSSYGAPSASPHGGGGGYGGGEIPLSPFLGGIGQLTASVKDIKSTIGEQKAKTAYQVAAAVKNTGNAAHHAILNKGHTAAAIVGQTVQTAGQVLRSKGETATRVIAGTGQLASSAVKSVGNVGASLLRSKGELVGSVLRTGTEIGTAALGAVSNGLAKGTYLVKAKGDAASHLVAKGGRLASGVIGTKGRIISSVINAKGQFAAQIIEAKGRGIATVLETSGQKLSQLADVIKSVTSNKYQPIPGPNYGWSEHAASYAIPPSSARQSSTSATIPSASPSPVYKSTSSQSSVVDHNSDEIKQAKEVPVTYYKQQADYADSYYDPRDNYNNYRDSRDSQSNQNQNENENQNQNQHQNPNQRQRQQTANEQEESEEELQNEYSTYRHQPNQYDTYYKNYQTQWE